MFLAGAVLCANMVCNVITVPSRFEDKAKCESVAQKLVAEAPKAPYLVGGCLWAADSWKPNQEQLDNFFITYFKPSDPDDGQS